jgi:hypothetical protein
MMVFGRELGGEFIDCLLDLVYAACSPIIDSIRVVTSRYTLSLVKSVSITLANLITN